MEETRKKSGRKSDLPANNERNVRQGPLRAGNLRNQARRNGPNPLQAGNGNTASAAIPVSIITNFSYMFVIV